MQNFALEFNRLENNTETDASKLLRKILLKSVNIGFQSVDPSKLVLNAIMWKTSLSQNSKELIARGFNGSKIVEIKYNLSNIDSVLIVGGGKAAYAMANSIIQILGIKIPCYGLVNLPIGIDAGKEISFEHKNIKSSVVLNYSRHPIPDEGGMNGTQQMVEMVKKANEKTFIIVLISGGGSALMPFPKKEINLAIKQKVNSILLQSGANIQEINTIRKHLSQFKGGNLARYIYPHESISLIISDVLNDPLDVIASGPTVADKSTCQDEAMIIKKYNIENIIPSEAKDVIIKGIEGKIPENPKDGDKVFDNIKSILIGSVENAKMTIRESLNQQHLINIKETLPEYNYPIMIGEASEYGKKMVDILKKITDKLLMYKANKNIPPMDTYFYLINSGEFTVTIKGKGIGGRNQEMLLSMLNTFKTGSPSFLNYIDFSIISIAFDGIEGNSPAAGAIIDSNTLKKIDALKIDTHSFLLNNDSYSFFKKIGDAIEIGQTGTNVNDLSLLIVNLKQVDK